MAKRSAYLHIGPAVPGLDALHDALRDDPALARAGVALPSVEQDLMDRADIEIRRRHTAVGVRRKDVEGSWARVCRKAFKAPRDVLISQPGFVDATREQVALAVDGLAGLRLHVVVTPADVPDGVEAGDLVGPWSSYVRRDSRIHVLPTGDAPTIEDVGAGLARLALLAREAELERRLVKLTTQRRRVRDRLNRVDAA